MSSLKSPLKSSRSINQECFEFGPAKDFSKTTRKSNRERGKREKEKKERRRRRERETEKEREKKREKERRKKKKILT